MIAFYIYNISTGEQQCSQIYILQKLQKHIIYLSIKGTNGFFSWS